MKKSHNHEKALLIPPVQMAPPVVSQTLGDLKMVIHDSQLSILFRIQLHIEYRRILKNYRNIRNRAKSNKNKAGVINDPLSQTHSLASSDHCFRFKLVWFCKVGTNVRTCERTTCAKSIITTEICS